MDIEVTKCNKIRPRGYPPADYRIRIGNFYQDVPKADIEKLIAAAEEAIAEPPREEWPVQRFWVRNAGRGLLAHAPIVELNSPSGSESVSSLGCYVFARTPENAAKRAAKLFEASRQKVYGGVDQWIKDGEPI